MRFKARQPARPQGSKKKELFSTFLSDRYVPVRGLVYSVLTHEVTVFAILFLSMFSIIERARVADAARTIELSELRDVLYLPVLGSGASAEGFSEGDESAGEEEAAGIPEPVTEGLSYPGPQPMVSDFPVPTNEIQTIQRPSLDNPPTVEPSLSLPNIVQTADAGPAPEVQFDPTEPIEDPQLTLPPGLVTAPALRTEARNQLTASGEVPAGLPEVDPRLEEIQQTAAAPVEFPELELPARLFPDVAQLEPQAPPSVTPEVDPRLQEPFLTEVAPPAPLETPQVEAPPQPFRGATSLEPQAAPSALPSIEPRLEEALQAELQLPGSVQSPQLEAPSQPFRGATNLESQAAPSALPTIEPRLEEALQADLQLPGSVQSPQLEAAPRPFRSTNALEQDSRPSSLPQVEADLEPLNAPFAVAAVQPPPRTDTPLWVLPAAGFQDADSLAGAAGPAVLPDVTPELEEPTGIAPPLSARTPATLNAPAPALSTSGFQGAAGLESGVLPASLPSVEAPQLGTLGGTGTTPVQRPSASAIAAPAPGIGGAPQFQGATGLASGAGPASLPSVEAPQLGTLGGTGTTPVERPARGPVTAPTPVQGETSTAFQTASGLGGQAGPSRLPSVQVGTLGNNLGASETGISRPALPAAAAPQGTTRLQARSLEPSGRMRPPRRPPTLTDFPNEQLSPVETRGPDSENLLVLTPMPALPERVIAVPAGEARGEFVISPNPNLASAEAAPGTGGENSTEDDTTERDTSGPQGLIGLLNQIQADNAAPVAGAAGDAGPGAPAGGDGEVRPGGNNPSRPGAGVGAGTGDGAGEGENPFPGVSVVRGGTETGVVTGEDSEGDDATDDDESEDEEPLQRSYGVTVISTEEGGGGLPDFGLFANEQVYTVFLDMRERASETPRTWTVEYAVPRGTAVETASPGEDGENVGRGLLLPFPVVKSEPSLPGDLVQRYQRRMVIVYGIVNTEGKLEQLSVKQSPHVLLNAPVLNALEGWSFRPAQLAGEPVEVKILLGIPLWLPPDSETPPASPPDSPPVP